LQCAQGSIHLENDKLSLARCDKWSKNETGEEIEIPPFGQNGQEKLLADFAESIRTNTLATTSGADNLHSFAAIIAGVISTTERRTVDVAELLDRP
jgi:predicted dehydrogenase